MKNDLFENDIIYPVITMHSKGDGHFRIIFKKDDEYFYDYYSNLERFAIEKIMKAYNKGNRQCIDTIKKNTKPENVYKTKRT